MTREFVVFADDWGRHPSSCQHLFAKVAVQHRVLWINTIGLRLPRFSIYDFKRGLEKVSGWMSQAFLKTQSSRPVLGNHLYVYSPVSTPINTTGFYRRLNASLMIRGIRRQMQRLGMHQPIVVAGVPNVADVIGHLGEKLVVYYCYDDFTLWPGVEKDTVLNMERTLLNKADLVLATSVELQRTRQGMRGSTRLFPHGVDVRHFSSSAHPDLAVAEEFAHATKPVIGYFGLLDDRIDYDLLKAMAVAHPEWILALVGPVQTKVSTLRHLPNVWLMGKVPYSDLPRYVKAFSVCIMPYVVNDLTNSISPLKMREYLATGKPVVSTDVADAKRFNSALRVAEGRNAFIRSVEVALENGVSSQEQVARTEALRGQSWEDKARELLELVTSEIARR